MQQIDQNNANQQEQEAPFQTQQQPGVINIKLTVSTQSTKEMNLEMNVKPDMPFNVFINQAMKQIFAQEMPKYYEEEVIFMLDQAIIPRADTTSLKILGFKQNSELKVKLKLKGGSLQQ